MIFIFMTVSHMFSNTTTVVDLSMVLKLLYLGKFTNTWQGQVKKVLEYLHSWGDPHTQIQRQKQQNTRKECISHN